jgi:hypothetical protein
VFLLHAFYVLPLKEVRSAMMVDDLLFCSRCGRFFEIGSGSVALNDVGKLICIDDQRLCATVGGCDIDVVPGWDEV